MGWYVGEAWHVAALTPAIEREAGVTGEVPLVSADLAGLDEAPHKILCIAGQDTEIPALHRVAQGFRGTCAVSFSHTNFLEITALGVDKAKAVEALASRLGASLAQVAAIGDSDNDRAMIEAVGLGIAMGNASAELRSRAAWVTGTNQEAGVARAIERLIESATMWRPGADAMSVDLPARSTSAAKGDRSLLASLQRLLRASGLIWAFLLLCLVATLISPHFVQPANLINVLRQVALFGTISVGMTFVILTKGIDLSVGSLVGVVGVSTALMLGAGVPIALTVPLALVLGALLGAVNGLGITLGNIPPFIMTLGMMVMARGGAMTLAGGQPVYLGDQTDAFYWLGGGEMLGMPVPVWVFAIVALVAFYALRHTPYGRNVYAVGSNAEAARLSGIHVGRIIFSVYVISGVLSALTALIFVSRLTVGEPTAGTGLELEAIAITVIGGTSLFGGEGGIGGTMIGAAILAVLCRRSRHLAGVWRSRSSVKGADHRRRRGVRWRALAVTVHAIGNPGGKHAASKTSKGSPTARS